MAKGNGKSRWGRLAFGAFVCVLIAVAGFYVYTAWQMVPRNWGERRLVETQASGTLVVKQIEAYRAANGRWPARLDELTGPVAAPTVGLKRWVYFADQERFLLKVEGAPNGYPSLYFDSRDGKWRVED